MTDTACDQLARLMHDFGAEWQIWPRLRDRHLDGGRLADTEAARDVTELEVKLKAATPDGRQRSEKGLAIVPDLAGPSAGPSQGGGPVVNDLADDTLVRLRSRDIADLRFHWDEAYDITWDGRFRAVRLDGGGSLEAQTAGELHVHIRDDYAKCPVRRPP